MATFLITAEGKLLSLGRLLEMLLREKEREREREKERKVDFGDPFSRDLSSKTTMIVC